MNRRKIYHPNRVQKFHDNEDGLYGWWIISVLASVAVVVLGILGFWIPFGIVTLIPLSLAHYYYRAVHHEAFPLEAGTLKLKVYDKYHDLTKESQKKISLSVDSIAKLTDDEAYEVFKALDILKDEEDKRFQLEAKMAARGKEITRSIYEVVNDVGSHNTSYEDVIKDMKKAELL